MNPETTNNQMRSGFLPDRILHLHPTRLCNLACLHCYSDSGPQKRSALPLPVLEPALKILKAEGYNLISISGGEPMTYGPLLPLIRYAHTLGFRVTMITNGLFPPKKLDEITSELDGFAISFDGLAETHNRMRGRPNAFEGACATLERQASLGRRVAAAISVTSPALAELPDLAYQLVDLGAKAIQVRPVALAGRARTMTGLDPFSTVDQARLYLIALALQDELKGEACVQCDLAPAKSLWQQREAYHPLLATCNSCAGQAKGELLLSDLINPLIITESGILKPIAYDFDPYYNLSSLESLSSNQLSAYKQQGLADFRMLIGSALVSLEHHSGLIDWFDHCTRLSELIEHGEAL